MAARYGEFVPCDNGVEVVRRPLRKEPPRQPHGTKHARGERSTFARKGVLQEAIVETGVVCDEQCTRGPDRDLVGNLGEGRRVADHRVGDAGKRLDDCWNGSARIDQRAPLGNLQMRAARVAAVDPDDADFGDGVDCGTGARGFQVDKR